MTHELATTEPKLLPKAEAGSMTPWAGFEHKLAFCAQMIPSGFLPTAVNTPAKALAIIQTGAELGIPPMHALRSINVIQGKPALSSELMAALMRRGGVRLEWLDSSPQKATLKATRPSGVSFTGIYSIEEAFMAGLVTKDGWKRYPAAMLRARAIALVARVIAPDMISGMYTPEELGADVDAEGAVVGAVVIEPAPAAEVPLSVSGLTGSPFEASTWIAALKAAKSAQEADE